MVSPEEACCSGFGWQIQIQERAIPGGNLATFSPISHVHRILAETPSVLAWGTTKGCTKDAAKVCGGSEAETVRSFLYGLSFRQKLAGGEQPLIPQPAFEGLTPKITAEPTKLSHPNPSRIGQAGCLVISTAGAEPPSERAFGIESNPVVHLFGPPSHFRRSGASPIPVHQSRPLDPSEIQAMAQTAPFAASSGSTRKLFATRS